MASRVTLREALDRAGETNALPLNTPFYNRRGDFLAIYFSEDDSYSERMDDVVTVYKSKETHRLTGCKLKGVSLLAQNVATLFNIHDGDILVRAILLNALGKNKPHRYIYDLRDLLGDISVSKQEVLSHSS